MLQLQCRFSHQETLLLSRLQLYTYLILTTANRQMLQYGLTQEMFRARDPSYRVLLSIREQALVAAGFWRLLPPEDFLSLKDSSGLW